MYFGSRKKRFKYGLERKLSDWKWWVSIISFQFIVGIILDWIWIKVGWGGESWSKFLLMFLVRVVLVLGTTAFIEYKLKDSLDRLNDARFCEVVRECKKDKKLWGKIENASQLNRFVFYDCWPEIKKDLINYMITHKLKLYEKDFLSWFICAGNLKWKKRDLDPCDLPETHQRFEYMKDG